MVAIHLNIQLLAKRNKVTGMAPGRNTNLYEDSKPKSLDKSQVLKIMPIFAVEFLINSLFFTVLLFLLMVLNTYMTSVRALRLGMSVVDL